MDIPKKNTIFFRQLTVFSTIVLSIIMTSFLASRMYYGSFQVIAASAIFLYILSHIVRGIRLWITISEHRLQIQTVQLSQFISSSLGNVTFPYAKDLGNVCILILYNRKIVMNAILAVFYLRLFDFLFFTPFWISSIFASSDSSKKITFLLFLLVFSIIFVAFLLFIKICDLISQHLLKHYHNILSTKTVLLLQKLKHNYKKMRLAQSEKMILVAILTLIAWTLEILSVALITGSHFIVVFSDVVQNISNPIFMNQSNATYLPLYLGFLMCTLAMLIIRIMDTKK